MFRIPLARRALCLLFAALALLSLCSSCATAQLSPQERLLAMLREETKIPAGRIYLRSAPTDDAAHLSNALLAQLFGNGALPPAVEGIVDAACYLSYSHPCELGVFLCRSAVSAQEVASMCLCRIDFLKAHPTYEGLDPAAVAACLENASVTLRGSCVILRIWE